MFLRLRLSAIVATALVLVACEPRGDQATLSFSLGQALQALTLEGVTVTRFELDVGCIDGSTTTVRGEVAEDGSFAADVPRCPNATLRFRGLTSASRPALAGRTDVVIAQASVDVVIPVRRVGTVTFVNDDTYASACAVTVANTSDFDARFILEPGASQELVLPTAGALLTCAPADTCAALQTCELSGPLAFTRGVAVPFGDASSLSLANLSSSLVFSIGPPSSVIAGLPFGQFRVTLVDERGDTIARDGISVILATDSPVVHGGFVNGTSSTVAGQAFFSNVSFTTAGPLTVKAKAVVDGVVLETQPITIQVAAGATTAFLMDAGNAVFAGQPLGIVVSAVDAFGNLAALPSSIAISSDDPSTVSQLFPGVPGSELFYTLFTAGRRSVTARDAANASVSGTIAIDVSPALGSALTIVGPVTQSVLVNQQVAFTVTARDAYGNVAPTYVGTVELQGSGVFSYGGPHTYTAGDAGVFTFTGVSWSAEASVSVKAVDTSQGIQSTQLAYQAVPAGTFDHIVVTPDNGTVTAGQLFDLSIRAVDALGSPATSFVGSVEVDTDTGVVVTQVFIESNGETTAQASVEMAGTYVLQARYNDAVVGTSAPLIVVPASAYELVVVQEPPSTVLAGSTFTVSFAIRDQYQNLVSPTGFSVALSLQDAPVLSGDGTVNTTGSLITFPALSVNAAASVGIGAEVSPAIAESSFASTNFFDVVPATSCSVVYVTPTPKGGNGCSPTTSIASIQTALTTVDNGGEIRVAAGTYTANLSITQTVTLRGGYEQSFTGAQDIFAHKTTLTASQNSGSVVAISSSGNVTVDGFVIIAPSVSSASVQSFGVTANGGVNLTLTGNRIIGPVIDGPMGLAAAVALNSVGNVIIRNNWIHVGGGVSAGPTSARYGIYGAPATGSQVVDIVGNTLYVPAGPTNGVYYSGFGVYRITNNLIVGDFTTCTTVGGSCALREQTSGSGFDSVQNNYLFELSAAVQPAYVYHTGSSVYSDLDAPGGPNFAGNVSDPGGLPSDIFAQFAGPDGVSYTMDDNDWHLTAGGNSLLRTGRDATQPTCGSGASPCNGSAFDIDGEAQTSPVTVGGDVYSVTHGT